MFAQVTLKLLDEPFDLRIWISGRVERSIKVGLAVIAVVDPKFVVEAAEQITLNEKRRIVNDHIGLGIMLKVFIVKNSVRSR